MKDLVKYRDKKEYKGIDICKFLLAIVVIASHTNLFVNISTTLIINIKLFIFSLVVPYFFIALGFLLENKIIRNKNDTNIIIKNKINEAIKLYILWTIIYLPITIYEYKMNGLGIRENVRIFLKYFIFLGEHFDSWHLWYLLSAIYSLIFIYIISKIKKEKFKLSIVFSTFIIGQVITYMITNQNNLNDVFYKIATTLSTTVFSGRLFNGIIYIYIGMKLPHMSEKVNNKICLVGGVITIIILGIIYGISNNIVRPFITLVASPILFLLSLNITFKKIKTLFFRKASTVIYFTHMIFYFIYSVVIHNKAIYYGPSTFIFVLTCSIILSITVYEIEKRKNIKIIKYLFG